MKQHRRHPSFTGYSNGDGGMHQQPKQQQSEAVDASWLTCGSSFSPAETLQRLGLSGQQLQQQEPLLLREYEAERAAQEGLCRAEEALVAGEISLERDEREHRQQLKMLQEQAKQQYKEKTEYIRHRERQGLQQQQQQEQQGHPLLPAADRRRRSCSSDESLILIEPSPVASSSTGGRQLPAEALRRERAVFPGVLRALEDGAAARETIWDSCRMQTAGEPALVPLSSHKQQQKRGRGARKPQQEASSSSSSSSNAEAAYQGEATSYPIEQRRQRKGRAAATGAAAEDSSHRGGAFSVYVEGLEEPLVFPVAEGPPQDDAAAGYGSCSSTEKSESPRQEQKQQQQEELLMLQLQDKLLMLSRQKPQDAVLWMQLVVLQEQLQQQQQPPLLSASTPEQLLLRQQKVLDMACSSGGGASVGGATTAVPPAMLVLRRLLLLQQLRTPLSDPAWLRTAAFVGKLSASSDSSSSSTTCSTAALTRCLCSAAAVTPQHSEASARLLLNELLSSAAASLAAAAAPVSAAPAAAATAAAAQEYRTCFTLLQELLFDFLLPLDVRAGRVAAAAATAQAIAHLALLRVQQQQQGVLEGVATPLEKLERIWNGRGDRGYARAGEVGQRLQQQQEPAASSDVSAVYLQLCEAADASVVAQREAHKATLQELLQSTTTSTAASLFSSNTCSNSNTQALRGFAAYCAADFALSASAWRSRVVGATTAADGGLATAAAESAIAGKIAASAAIAAANDAMRVGEAAAAASAAAAAAAADPSFVSVDGLRRAAEAAAAAARAATKSATEARTAAAAAAAADLNLLSPYGVVGDSMQPGKQWELLVPTVRAADAVLSAAAAGISCCSKTSSNKSGGMLAATAARCASYSLLLGVLDSLGAPTLHRFPSGHPRILRGGTAAAAAADGALLRCLALHLQQNASCCSKTGRRKNSDSNGSSSSSAAAFSFWWPSSSLVPVGEDSLLKRQTRAATSWVLAQRQLRNAVLYAQQQEGEKQEYRDRLWLTSGTEEATSPQAFAALVCSQALLVFPDDRLLIYCALCLCPLPKVFRLVLKRNEAEPALWLTFASSLFLQAATGGTRNAAPSSVSSSALTDKNSSQALLLQGRKVLLTCCSAFASFAPLAASWAFLELTTAAAAARTAVKVQAEQQQQPETTTPLPPLLGFGWPWACWLGRLDWSQCTSGCEKQLPFEGWGISTAGLHVGACSADRSFLSFDPALPGVPQQKQQLQQQQDQEQQYGCCQEEDEETGALPFRRSHVAASCALLLQRSRIAASGAAAVTAATASAFPLLTSAPWANLFLALLMHSALSPVPATVWELFEQYRGPAAAASAATIAAGAGSSRCCACCCGCSSSTAVESQGSSLGSSSTSASSKSSVLALCGLCSNAEAARCEELALAFVLVLLLTTSRTAAPASEDSDAMDKAENREKIAAEDLAVLLRASKWMLWRFSSNPFFLAVHSQLLLRQGREGRRKLRSLYRELLRGPPWLTTPPVSPAVASAGEQQLRPWPSSSTLESAFLSEWLIAQESAANVSLKWLHRYVQWASSSSALPFALLERLPGVPEGMPCGTAVLQREQQIWVYLQALLLSSSGISKYSSAGGASGVPVVMASLDGSFLSWLCEGLCPPTEQQLQPNEGDQQQRVREEQQQQVSQMEERLLQAVSQCPFSKRLWLMLLHVLHVKRRQAGARAETALTGGAQAAEEAVLLLDEALQRGIFFYADPIAALAAS